MTRTLLTLLVGSALCGVAVGVGPVYHKVDPEPTPRTPVGSWTGRCIGYEVMYHFNRNGTFHHRFGGTYYSGCWHAVKGRPRNFKVREWALPGHTNDVINSYDFRLSPDGKSLKYSPSFVLRRVK